MLAGRIRDAMIAIQATSYAELLAAQRAYFATGATRSIAFRVAQLEKLEQAINQHEPAVFAALKADLGKNEVETFITEVNVAVDELRHARKHVRRWAKTRTCATPLVLQPGKSELRREPKGVGLIIGPWNYPFQLIVVPLVAAIAAGNCCVVKPSELAPATSAVLARIVGDAFDPAYVACVEGGIEAATALLDLQFDHIFFTGGAAVGRIILEKAAKFLTPVTLELGGKSPTFVTNNANVRYAADRLVWGKYVNAGQTCVAPDYVLVERGVAPELVARLQARITEVYGRNPKDSPDFARIVNERHVRRLASYLGDGTVVAGGEVDEAQRYVAPTVITALRLDAPLMSDEVFGPILPIVEVDSVDAALAITQARPRPLAMYVFSEKRSEIDYILARQPSGGVCINDLVVHFANPHLSFGGTGSSGYGAYHGVRGFEEFSHARAVFTRRLHFANPLAGPPYTGKLATLKRLLKLVRFVD